MDPHRKACRRAHYILGHYFASKAWVLGVDCVVIKRRELEELLGIERFRGPRREWMAEDFLPWFPYQETYHRSGSADTFYSIYLSRVEIASHLPAGTMMDEERISRMGANTPPTAILFPDGIDDVPCLEKIVTELALLSAGLATPVVAKRKTTISKKLVKKAAKRVVKKAAKKIAC